LKFLHFQIMINQVQIIQKYPFDYSREGYLRIGVLDWLFFQNIGSQRTQNKEFYKV
jgi:hypothetical protein